MTFLSGLFLLAIPLVGIPIVLHFYHKKQRDTIPWGAMSFLLDDVPRGNWWNKIEQYLILFLRCLALGALIFALSRPLVDTTVASTPPVSRMVVILLDDSLSTDFQNASGQTLFESLKQQAFSVLDQLTSRDEVWVAMMANGPRFLTEDAVQMTAEGKQKLVETIQGLKCTQGQANLLDSLQAVSALPFNQKLSSCQLFVLADRQAVTWSGEAEYRWQQLIDGFQSRTPRVEVCCLTTSPEQTSVVNLGIERLNTSSTRSSPMQPVVLLAEVKNYGQLDAEATELIWKVDGQEEARVATQKVVSGESQSLRWVHQFKTPGVHLVECELTSDDRLAADDMATISIEIVEKIPMLIVAEKESLPGIATEADFVRAALGDQPTAAVDLEGVWSSVFVPKVIEPRQILDESLDTCHVVMMLNVSGEIDVEAIQKIKQFVDRGGGLWITLGQSTDVRLVNQNYFDQGNGIIPCQIKGLKDYGREPGQSGLLHPPDQSHPATALLADTQRLDIDQVQVYREYQLDLANRTQDYRLLLKSGRGSPMAVESYYGKGRIFLMNFPLDEKWTNLPLTKSFVVLINDWLAYLASPNGIQYNLLPGQPLEYLWTANPDVPEAEVTATLVSPTGRKQSRVIDPGVTSIPLVWREIDLPGVYRLTIQQNEQSSISLPYSVGRDPGESDLTVITESDEAFLSEMESVVWARLDQTNENSFSERSASQVVRSQLDLASSGLPQTPLWKSALLCLLVAFVLELFLSSRSSSLRFGTALRR